MCPGDYVVDYGPLLTHDLVSTVLYSDVVCKVISLVTLQTVILDFSSCCIVPLQHGYWQEQSLCILLTAGHRHGSGFRSMRVAYVHHGVDQLLCSVEQVCVDTAWSGVLLWLLDCVA